MACCLGYLDKLSGGGDWGMLPTVEENLIFSQGSLGRFLPKGEFVEKVQYQMGQQSKGGKKQILSLRIGGISPPSGPTVSAEVEADRLWAGC